MADPLGEFAWDVADGGYRIVRARPAFADGAEEEPAEYVVPAKTDRPGRWRYSPLQAEPALFKAFAETEPTEENVLAFSARYGLLRMEWVAPLDGGEVTVGERLSEWRSEHARLHSTLELWEAARRGDLAYLNQVITRDDDSRWAAYRGPSGAAAMSLPPDGGPMPGDLVELALWFVQRTVNEKLESAARPRLLWENQPRRLRLFVVPTDLLGALWLQLARAIDGDRKYRRCQECGRWFEVSPETARTNRVYCSNACRQKAYRRRLSAETGGRRNGEAAGDR